MRCWAVRSAVGEGVELVNQALGVDPARSVPADGELAGAVADDDAIGQEAVRGDAAQQRALGGDAHGIGRDLESGDAKLLEMGLPRRRHRRHRHRGRSDRDRCRADHGDAVAGFGARTVADPTADVTGLPIITPLPATALGVVAAPSAAIAAIPLATPAPASASAPSVHRWSWSAASLRPPRRRISPPSMSAPPGWSWSPSTTRTSTRPSA